MKAIGRIFIALVTFNIFAIIFQYSSSVDNNNHPPNLYAKPSIPEDPPTQEKEKDIPTPESNNLNPQKDTKDTDNLTPKTNKVDNKPKEIETSVPTVPKLATRAVKSYEAQKGVPKSPFPALVNPRSARATFERENNPFYRLGAYPDFAIQIPYENKTEEPLYDQPNYGLFNDADYCERVDYYNLGHPANIFEKANFFSDYGFGSVPRDDVMPHIGRNTMPEITRYGKNSKNRKREFHLDITVNSFFLNIDTFYKYHQIGKNFLCATQMYNRIPGNRALIRKDVLVESVDRYAAKFSDRTHCFNKQMFFPYSYRLYRQEECEIFFNKINSEEYQAGLKSEPIQFIVKVGHGSHSAEGVFLLDQNYTQLLNTEFNNGKLCGQTETSLIAQTYISNPLLLDMNNKFDFRVYMLIASVNPLIVYYHDGFLRASLSEYDKFSNDRSKHLTNTHVADSIFEKAREEDKVNNMTEDELRNYHIWKFEELEDYLLETGKIDDPEWLENYLRPQFQKAMIHLVKMSSQFFWNQSNVYGLFGLDFMLDDKFNLWFIEGNPSPQLLATNEYLGNLLSQMLKSLFEIEFGLYRSRMKRVIGIVQEIMEKEKQGENVDDSIYKEHYQKAAFNRLEPEYKISKGNSFTLIMDESKSGAEAYFGNIEPDCFPS